MKLRPMFPPPEITFKMVKPQPFCLLRTKHHLVSKIQLLAGLLQLHTVLKFESLADLPPRVHLNFDQNHIELPILSAKLMSSSQKFTLQSCKILLPTRKISCNDQNSYILYVLWIRMNLNFLWRKAFNRDTLMISRYLKVS